MSADKRSVSTDALETLGKIHTRPEFRDAIHLAVEPVEAGEVLNPGTPIVIRDGKAHRPMTQGWGIDSTNAEQATGIVDPFLPRAVLPGERFWFVINPRMITSLRHVWSHPLFPEESSVDKDEIIQFLTSIKTDLEPDPFPVPVFVEPDPTISIVEQIRQKQNDQIAADKEAAKASAYNWIVQYASSISGHDSSSEGEYDITAEELIDTAKTHIGATSWGGDYLVKGGLLEGEYTSPMFWEKLAIYLDIEIPDSDRNNFFSCSC